MPRSYHQDSDSDGGYLRGRPFEIALDPGFDVAKTSQYSVKYGNSSTSESNSDDELSTRSSNAPSKMIKSKSEDYMNPERASGHHHYKLDERFSGQDCQFGSTLHPSDVFGHYSPYENPGITEARRHHTKYDIASSQNSVLEDSRLTNLRYTTSPGYSTDRSYANIARNDSVSSAASTKHSVRVSQPIKPATVEHGMTRHAPHGYKLSLERDGMGYYLVGANGRRIVFDGNRQWYFSMTSLVTG